MIEALFNQPNYVATKKLLDLTALRHEAIASNLANAETPRYKRLEVSKNFELQLREAIASKDPARIAALKPEIGIDYTAVSNRKDGNTVKLEEELLRLNQNTLEHTLETQLITGRLLKLRLAITGRP